MKKSLFYLTVLVLIYSCSSNGKDSIRLVENGKSEYSIVIPVEASPEEVRAAEFLREHLSMISTCILPVINSDTPDSDKCIVISKSDKITTPDGFSVKTKGERVEIYGGSNKGCIYGVSEILEKHLGVRYYSPDYIVIPKNLSISLPEFDTSDSTSNTFRNVHGQFSKNQDYKDFHRVDEISDMFADKYYVHTFQRLLPWKDYLEEHPEYYAFMNGKRIKDQLCLSNAEVYDIVVEKLKEEMALQPDKIFWSVSQDDNFSYCHCDDCSKIIEEEESPAGPIIRFVNQVAEQFPDKVISTLAYQYSRKAPVNTKPLDNVQVMLCTIELNRSKAISEDSASRSFVQDIVDWGKICNHIYLWDYTVDFAHSLSPFPNLHTLQPNIQLFVQNNVSEHFQQTNTAVGHEFSELKSYLLNKLLWNPNADVESLIVEFTDGFYGPAAPSIRKYIYQMQDEILNTGEWLDIYGPPTNYQNTFLSAENIADYNAYFDKAEKVVADDADFLLHVRTARMQVQYAMMEIGKNDMFGSRGWYLEKEGEFEVNPEMIAVLEKFYQTGVDASCKRVNESGLTVKEYYESTKRFIDVQVEGNFAFRKKVTAQPSPDKKYSEGDLSFLTNGVRGANDYKVHWLGWNAQDFNLILDLEDLVEASKIEISTLWDHKSWIMHPISVSCFVSTDGVEFVLIDKQLVEGNQQDEEVNRTFSFDTPSQKYRYVKFDVRGSLTLFDWHPSSGYPSWVFVDEIVVK